MADNKSFPGKTHPLEDLKSIKQASKGHKKENRMGSVARDKMRTHEEVELGEGVDKNHPIVKEYNSLKKHDIKDLRDMIGRQHKVIDTAEFNTKDHAISHLLRQKHGNKKVAQAFGFNEEAELDEALNVQQRQKRAAIMRRYKSKIERSREIAKGKVAPEANIKKRAYAQARQILRRKLAGPHGAEYEKLGPSEKMAIDRLLDKKGKAIKKLALRLVPRVKKAEYERLQSYMHGKTLVNQGAPEGKISEEFNNLFLEYFGSSAPGNSGSTGERTDNPITADKTNVKSKKKKDTSSVKILGSFSEEADENSSIFKSLERKANTAKVALGIIGEVYDRGLNAWSEDCNVSQQQYAFARVNSYINQGKTYFNEDADLHEGAMMDHLFRTKHKHLETGETKEVHIRARDAAEARNAVEGHYGHSKQDWKYLGTKQVAEEIESLDEIQINWDNPLQKHSSHKTEKGTYGVFTSAHNKNKFHIRMTHDQDGNKLPAAEGRRKYSAGPMTHDQMNDRLDKLKEEVEQIHEIGDTPKGKQALGAFIKDREKNTARFDRNPNWYTNRGGSKNMDKLNRDLEGRDRAELRLNRPDVAYDKERLAKKEVKDSARRKFFSDPDWAKKAAAKTVMASSIKKEHVELDESNNVPYVKPHTEKGSTSQSGWKASNKHGNVKYFGMDFKKSAEKHAGISEETLDELSQDKLERYRKARIDSDAHLSSDKYDKSILRAIGKIHNDDAFDKERGGRPDGAKVKVPASNKRNYNSKTGKFESYSEETDLDEAEMKGKDPCWKGYEMIGTKKKRGKEVPNCVPANEARDPDANTKARRKVQNVERDTTPETTSSDAASPKDPCSDNSKQQRILKKTIMNEEGNAQSDPKKRLVGTDSLVKTYKKDTPYSESLDKSFKAAFSEDVVAADKKGEVVAGHKRIVIDPKTGEQTTIDVPAHVRNAPTGKKIIKSGNINDGKPG